MGRPLRLQTTAQCQVIAGKSHRRSRDAMALRSHMRFGIRSRSMGFVAALLALKVSASAPADNVWIVVIVTILRRTLFCEAQAAIKVPLTLKCSSDVRPCRRTSATISSNSRLPASASASLSRFFETIDGLQTGSSTLSPTKQRNNETSGSSPAAPCAAVHCTPSTGLGEGKPE